MVIYFYGRNILSYMRETQLRDKHNFLIDTEECIKICLERILDSPAPSLSFSLVAHTALY